MENTAMGLLYFRTALILATVMVGGCACTGSRPERSGAGISVQIQEGNQGLSVIIPDLSPEEVAELLEEMAEQRQLTSATLLLAEKRANEGDEILMKLLRRLEDDYGTKIRVVVPMSDSNWGVPGPVPTENLIRGTRDDDSGRSEAGEAD